MPSKDQTQFNDKRASKRGSPKPLVKNSETAVQKIHPATIIQSADSLTPRDVLQLQRTIGNHAVNRLIQAKFNVSQPGDEYEREADRVAKQVMRTPEQETTDTIETLGNQVQPFTQEEKRERAEENIVQTQRENDIESQIESMQGKGDLLPDNVRTYFESKFGHDFSGVRVHEGAQAAETAKAINAKAYTMGKDIVFGAGEYAPETAEGKKILAHELTHVLQQNASSTDVALMPAAPQMILRQPEGVEESTKETAEDKERAKLLTEFTVGAVLPEKQVSRIESAMRAFSLDQLRVMRKAGVRFWAPDSLPPEFKDKAQVKNLSSPGEYVETLRIIRMAKNASTDAIRHEMAHAWDHVRTGKVKRIDNLEGKAFEKALADTPALSSETKEKRATKETHEGKTRSVSIPISEMLARYKRWKLREQSFDNPSTREGYSKQSTREFYAEGYSVFHGGKEWNQARLLYYAPELYELLEAEAKQQGLSVPDRSKIEAALKEQKLQ